MEYLLMHDDSVLCINKVLQHAHVLAILKNVEGAKAYYWHSPDFQWGSFIYDPNEESEARVTHETDNVPDVIKLAAMLE